MKDMKDSDKQSAKNIDTALELLFNEGAKSALEACARAFEQGLEPGNGMEREDIIETVRAMIDQTD